MNFYTLTFKKKILIALGAIISLFIVLDIALYLLVDMKSTKTNFIDDKFSKIKHFKQNATKDREIIFVGSSRTFFNVSTNTFKNNGLDIYNFGISGAQFEDYPTIIAEIVKHPPKEVVISLTVDRLYDELEISGLPTLEEIGYYASIDKVMALEALKQWFVNLHLFLVHSETIYYKIVSLYEKFEPKKHKITTEAGNDSDDYDTLSECHVFDVQHTGDILTTLKCTNGDGALLGNHITKKKQAPIQLEKFNKKSLQYIQHMVSTLQKHHIKVTFVFEPIWHNPYHYDLKKIKNQFKDVTILDLSSYNVDDTLWADAGHFNYKGRKKYSQYLSAKMKALKN